MKTNFERSQIIIKKLFPRARKNIKDPDISVEAMVSRRLNQLSQGYGNRLLKDGRDPIDYSKATTHIAYCYRTMPAHGDWLSKVMDQAAGACKDALKSEKARICSIGGGPGSDILGVMKFADKQGLLDGRKFRFAVLDREVGWNIPRSYLVDTYRDEADVVASFVRFDVSRLNKWVADWFFSDADLFTFSFFLSEVWSFNKESSVSAFLQSLFDRAKVGAVFVYVDNGGAEFAPLADSEFARADMELLATGADKRMLMNFDEQCSILNEYQEQFGQKPKLTGDIAWRIWRKKSG